MNNVAKIFLVLPMVCLVGCSNFTSATDSSSIISSTATENTNSPTSTTTSSSNSSTIDESLTYLDLFDENNRVDILIDIKDEELQKIENDFQKYPKNGFYRIADKVTFTINKDDKENIFVFDEVGIRMKGNTSRTNFYSQGTINNMIHYKLSFEETFDDETIYGDSKKVWNDPIKKQERKDRTFLGLSKLDLKWNKNYDATHIKEIYAMKMFKENGILAPLVTLGNVKINQNSNKLINLGMFRLYETVDKSFIKRNLSSGDNIINMGTWDEEKNGTYGLSNSNYGDLYKCSYKANLVSYQSNGNNLYGEESDDGRETYVYDLKTNKASSKSPTDHSYLKKLIDALNKSSVTYQEIDSIVDLEYFASYEAISYLLGNPDDFRNNYNNFYIYFKKTDGKAIFIPIDYDRCLGITKDYNPDGAAMTSRTIFDNRTSESNNNENPLYNKTILANDNPCKTTYFNQVEALVNSKYWTNESFEELFNIYANNYNHEEDYLPTGILSKYGIGFSLKDGNMSFQEYISKKYKKENNPIPDGTLYLVGIIDEEDCWSSKKYPLSNIESGIYQIELVLIKSSTIVFKINNGGWDNPHYSVSEDNQIVDGASSNNKTINNLPLNTKITFNFDFNNKIFSYLID